MQIDRKQLMKDAWVIARRVARNFRGTPASRFGAALKSAWRNAKAAADPVDTARALAARLMRVTIAPSTGRDPWAEGRGRIAALQPMGVCPELDAAILHHRAAVLARKAAAEARRVEIMARFAAEHANA